MSALVDVCSRASNSLPPFSSHFSSYRSWDQEVGRVGSVDGIGGLVLVASFRFWFLAACLFGFLGESSGGWGLGRSGVI